MKKPGSRATAWVRAFLRGDRASLNELGPNGQLPPADAELAGRILLAAFDLVIPRWFNKDTPIRQITVEMLEVRARIGAKAAQPVIVMEMVVRKALGETVPVDDLDEYVLAKAKAGVLAQYVHSVGLLDDELDELVAEAERNVLSD
jgi:hypothetical protein